MPKTRPPYPPEYREQIIRLHQSGRTIASLAHEFEPSEQTIRNRVNQSAVDDGEREGLTSDEKQELKRLRREVARLKQEREILEKAAAWFAQKTISKPSSSS